LAHVLDQHYDIAVRAGYHCTPLAHETAGTLEHGAVRVSPGFFNTEDDIDQLIDSVRDIARRL